MTGSRRVFASLLIVLTSLALPTAARDLEDVLVDVGNQIGFSTHQDFAVETIAASGVGRSQFEELVDINSNILNDRLLPVSSSVGGFTFEYNPDLDVYERSTSTFGPLFTERAQTIGRNRLLVSASTSYLEFDEFEGDGISSLAASTMQPSFKVTTDTDSIFKDRDLGADLDILLDLDIEETVASFQFTYGLGDKIDVGVVVPLVHIDFEARATPVRRSGEPLLECDRGKFSLDLCATSGVSGTTKESEDHTGFGDIVVRGKWNFLNRPWVDAAAVVSATLPTGSPENLTGVHTMTFKPGLVVSRDLTTPAGGLSFHGFAAWEIRPDDSEFEEVEWAAGIAFQPLRAASLSVDFLGSHKMHNTNIGSDRFDASIGTKVMIAEGLLADFNVILPLNDDGLRPNAIFTAQFEYTFGD
ncbi:MAG: hypothetical protein GY725_06855 [bacterium]|nr:hypothetical protein [bacterium]